MTSPAAVRRSASAAQQLGSLRAHWVQGAGVGVLLQGVGLLLGFASSVLLARLLGPHGLGHYSFVLAIVAVLSVIAALGMPIVVARQLSAYQVRNEWGMARGIMRWSNLMVGVAGLVIGVCLILWGMVWGKGAQQSLYLLAAPLVVVLAWANIRQRALQGLHHPLASQLPEQFIKHTVFLVVAGALWAAGHEFILRSEGVMSAWLFAGLVSLLCGVVLLRRFSPLGLRAAQPQYESREWIAIAWPIYVADVLGVVLVNSDTIILGWMCAPGDVGIYQIALRLSGLMLVLMGASNWVLSPWFARFHTTGERERLQSVVTRTTRAIFAATMMLYLVLFFWGEALLGIFFGEKFVQAYPMLLILGAGQLVNVASGPVVNLLAMTGGQRALAWSATAMVVLNIILCFWLVKVLGPIGAAVAVAVTTSAYNMLLAVVVRRRSGLGATIFG